MFDGKLYMQLQIADQHGIIYFCNFHHFSLHLLMLSVDKALEVCNIRKKEEKLTVDLFT